MIARIPMVAITCRSLALAAAATALVASAAAAQTPSQPPPGSPAAVEVTPFVALGSSQSSLAGAAVAFPVTRAFSLEGEVGYRQGEVKGMTADLSLLWAWPRAKAFVPYLAAGVGLREYGMAVPSPAGVLFTQEKLALAVNAGGGLKVPLDSRWSFRTDARWFNGLGATAPEHWRLFTGVTLRWRQGEPAGPVVTP